MVMLKKIKMEFVKKANFGLPCKFVGKTKNVIINAKPKWTLRRIKASAVPTQAT